MKKNWIIVLTLYVLAACCRTDCNIWTDDIRLGIYDSATHQNALFGPDKKYDPDSLQIYYADNTTTITRYRYLDYSDTILFLDINYARDFVIKYPGKFDDTIHVYYNHKKTRSRCCGDSYGHYDSLVMNGKKLSREVYGDAFIMVFK